MEDIQVVSTVAPLNPITTPEVAKSYPLIEEMTFKCPVNSEEQAYQVLGSIQFLVNQTNAEEIISIIGTLIKNPSMMQKAKKYLPYLKMLS